MLLTEVIGYAASLAIGISLGLIGGGGSILTVPVMVYLFHINPLLATAYSLFIVGATSLVGAVPKYRQGLVHLPTAILFGIPSIAAVLVTRFFLLPHIPDAVATIGDFVITKDLATMLLFALLMVVASISLIWEKKQTGPAASKIENRKHLQIIAQGLLVGTLTGLVGAGGGFLIIPALVLLTRLPIKQAIGTSLVIIAANSLIGFAGDLVHHHMNWGLLLSVTALAIIGIFIGNWLNAKIDGSKLRKGFGWMVLAMGIYIIIKEALKIA